MEDAEGGFAAGEVGGVEEGYGVEGFCLFDLFVSFGGGIRVQLGIEERRTKRKTILYMGICR